MSRRARRIAELLVASACLATSCAHEANVAHAPSPNELSVLQEGRWEWVRSECVDGPLELGKLGFERSLQIEARGSSLRFTYDTTLVQPQCSSTEVWQLTPEAGGQWQLTPEAQVRVPAEQPCGAFDPNVAHGVLRLSGDTLEELRFGSPWCRGFDARFVYRRVPQRTPTPDELVRRYVAGWNRRDPSALAALFSEQAVLIEPFSRSPDGNPVRHEGREQIRRWFETAFASTPWLGLALDGVEPIDDHGQLLAAWRYMDPALASPLRGRNLLVLAGGEIFATEIQLLAEPNVARTEVTGSAASAAAAGAALAPR